MKNFLTAVAVVLTFVASFGTTLAATTVPWTKNGSVEYPTYFSDLISIGSTSPTTAFTVVDNSTAASSSFQFGTGNATVTNVGGGALINLQRANGTAAAKTVVSSGNSLGEVRGNGWDGTTYGIGADLAYTAGSNWTSSNHEGYLRFLTVPNGSTATAERARITSSGLFGIGSTSPNYSLSVNSAFGVDNFGTIYYGSFNPWTGYKTALNYWALQPGNGNGTTNYNAAAIYMLRAPDTNGPTTTPGGSDRESTYTVEIPIYPYRYDSGASDDYLDAQKVDFGTMNYGTSTGSGIGKLADYAYINVIGKGAGSTTPLSNCFWDQDVYASVISVPYCNWFDPSGAVAFGYASTTSGSANRYDPLVQLQVSSSTASTVFAVDAAPRNHLFQVNGNGNIGIGTSTPYTNLSVSGGAAITGDLNVGSSTPFPFGAANMNPWNFGANVPGFVAFNIGNINPNPAASADLVFYNGSSTATANYANCGFDNPNTTNGITYPFDTANAFYCYSSDGPATLWAATTSVASSYLTFGTLNQERLRITGAGNVGIGTTTPGNALTVNGVVSSGGSSNGNYQILNNAGAIRGQFQSTGTVIDIGSYNSAFPLTFTTNGTEKARLTSAGAFGIGSSTPWGLLSVNPNGFTSGSPFFTIGSSTATQFIVDNTGLTSVGSSTTGAKFSIYANAGETNTTLFAISSSTASATANVFTVSNTGAVSTAQTVTVGGQLIVNGQSGNSNVLITNAATNGTENIIVGRNASAGTAAKNRILLQNDNTTHTVELGLNSTGFTTSGSNVQDAGYLTVSANVVGGLGLGTVGTSPVLFFVNNAEVGRFASTTGNNFGIGTTSPVSKLSVQGGISAVLDTFATGDSAVCQNGIGGKITVDSGVSSCIVSSKFVKDPQGDIAYQEAYNRVMQLQPVMFKYKDSGKEDLGLYAEEVAKIDPRYAQYTSVDKYDAGHHFKVGDPTAINWSAINADMIVVLQHQTLATRATRSVEENWQWGLMALFALILVWQQYQIQKLKK